MKKTIKITIVSLILLLQTGCTICKTNTYKEDITVKYSQELKSYLGDYKIKDRAIKEENLCKTQKNSLSSD